MLDCIIYGLYLAWNAHVQKTISGTCVSSPNLTKHSSPWYSGPKVEQKHDKISEGPKRIGDGEVSRNSVG